MLGINYWAVIAAAVAAFVQGGLWYSPLLFGKAYLALRGMNAGAADTTPPVGTIVAELVRCLVVAFVLAHFVVALDVVDWIGAVQLAAWLWVGFQAMAILGSVIHENYPWRLYALHGRGRARENTPHGRHTRRMALGEHSRSNKGVQDMATDKAGKIEVENVIHPGNGRLVDAAMYEAMKRAFLKILPKKSPGMTTDEIRAGVLPHLPEKLFPGGAKAGWWTKTVQLDLEAKGIIAREKTKPLRLHKA